tara:strand:- start:139 stop:279 length:141 start_codon:yes stop_codon:yes gene_type:complete
MTKIYKKRNVLEYVKSGQIVLKAFDNYYDRKKWIKDNKHRYMIINP